MPRHSGGTESAKKLAEKNFKDINEAYSGACVAVNLTNTAEKNFNWRTIVSN